MFHWRTCLILATSFMLLSACQTPHSVSQTPPTPLSQAKGEWSLAHLSGTHTFDLQPMHYRISLRITRQEFNLAAPCSRLLGHYRSNEDVLQFSHIHTKPITCGQTEETPHLKNLLQQTHRYRLQDEQMHWFNQQGDTLAIWERIYL